MKTVNGTSLLVTAVLAACGFTATAMGQDECATATLANLGPNHYSLATATASADAVDDTQCAGTYLDWNNSPDVWFTYTSATSGTINVNTCDAAGGHDSSLLVYSGSCGALVQVACNGDGTGIDGCQGFYSNITGVNIGAGETVFFRIGSWNGVAGGAGTLTVQFTAVDEGCLGATGSCAEAHGGPGCDDPTCCSAVCAIDPLCCIIGWDTTCLGYAVDACGIFIYNCDGTGPANNCATNATVVGASGTYAFNNVGATQDGPAYGSTCSSGNNENNNDVWYRVGPVFNGNLVASTCGTTPFDSKLAIFDMGTDPAAFDFTTLPDAFVNCNDDGADCFQTDGTSPFASEMTTAVNVGRYYLVCVSSYAAGDTGAGQITFTLPEPCALPASTGSEGEACGTDTNGGCGSGTELATSIGFGDAIAGNFWADAGTRDVDWYALEVTTSSSVTVELSTGSNAVCSIYKGDTCSGLNLVANAAGFCPVATTTCLPVGSYRIAVATSTFEGTPCGSGAFNDYVLKVTGVDADCPSFGDVCSYDIASTLTQNNALDVTNYTTGCQLWCGANGTQFSTASEIARSFSGLSSGSLACATIGYANVDQQLDGSLVANAFPVAMTLGLYRDTNGGDPTLVNDGAGNGGDLELITSKDFLMLGGFGLLTWNLDTPLDLTGNTDPIVLLMNVSSSDSCTADVNFIAGGVGNNTGSTAFWFEKSTDGNGICNDATFVAQTGEAQWIAELGFAAEGNPCPSDLDGNGTTDAADLAALLGSWGQAGASDLDGNGTTDAADLAALLGSWGACQ